MQKKGLTLLEIVVATMIFAMVVAGLANIFVAGTRWIQHSRYRMTGGELGRYFLEPLQQYVDQRSWNTGNCLTGAGCPAVPQTIDGRPYTPSYVVTPVAGTSIRKVRATISWTEPAP